MIRRGDIRWFRFSAPDKRRPVLVLGREDQPTTLSQLTVIPFSTKARCLPWEVAFGLDDGLHAPCVLKPEWIKTVERSDLGPCITRMSERRWPEVRQAVLTALGLE